MVGLLPLLTIGLEKVMVTILANKIEGEVYETHGVRHRKVFLFIKKCQFHLAFTSCVMMLWSGVLPPSFNHKEMRLGPKPTP